MQVRASGASVEFKAHMNIALSIAKLAFESGDQKGCRDYIAAAKIFLETAGMFWHHFLKLDSSKETRRSDKMRALIHSVKSSLAKKRDAEKTFEGKVQDIVEAMKDVELDQDMLALLGLPLAEKLNSHDQVIELVTHVERQADTGLESLVNLASELIRDSKGFQCGGAAYWRGDVADDAYLDDLLLVADGSIFVEKALKPKALGAQVVKFVEARGRFRKPSLLILLCAHALAHTD